MRPSPSSSFTSTPISYTLSYGVLSVVFILLFHTSTVVVEGLTTPSPPAPRARPILVGTSDYSNVLFGKLQRAASLYGTNLEQPASIVRNNSPDSDKSLNKCLWSKFCMADYGPDGILDEDDLLRPLSPWIPMANVENDLLFLDGMNSNDSDDKKSSSSPFGFAAALFQKKKSQEEPTPTPTPAASEEATMASVILLHEPILACAAERYCSHVYVLVEDSTLPAYTEILSRYKQSHNLSSTIVCVATTAQMQSTPGWISSRPQDLEGDMVGPVALSRRERMDDSESVSSLSSLQSKDMESTESSKSVDYNSREMPLILPMEDASEVMLQIALRTERSPAHSPRIVTIYPGSADTMEESMMEDRPNRSYFTMTGGKQARKAAGTVKSVSSWVDFLSPLGGKVDGKVARRPDVNR